MSEQDKPKLKLKPDRERWWLQHVEVPLLLLLVLAVATGFAVMVLFRPPPAPIVQRIEEIVNPTATYVPPDPSLTNYTLISSLASATPADAASTPYVHAVDGTTSACTDVATNNGEKFVFTLWLQRSKELYRMDGDGSNLCYLTRDNYVDDQAAWSPDGTKIAFVSTREGYGIYVMDHDGSNKRKVTDGGSAYSFPAWSPDGEHLIFQATIDEQFDLYTITLDAIDLRNLTNQPRLDTVPAWSPDGQYIAFASDRTFNPFIPNRLEQIANYEIYLMDADGLNIHRLTSNDVLDFHPTWSPDSLRIAFQSQWSGVYVMNRDGSELQFLSDGRNPVWSANSDRIAFLRGDQIHLMNSNGDDVRQISEIHSIIIMDYWSE